MSATDSSTGLPAMQADYNLHSRNQSQSLQLFKPFIDAAVAAHSSSPLPSSPTGAFVIADFGCSTGLNSSDALGHVITGLREKYGMERCGCVLAVLNDLPRNPWSELFGFLHGDGRSVLSQHQGVFALASGKSCYEQILPPNTLQFGISNICLHWCSRLPTRIANHCFALLGSPEEQQLFRQQATADWTAFLRARATELVSGGMLALNVHTTQEECIPVFDEIYRSASSLADRGVINEEELLNFNFNMCFRTLEELSEQEQYTVLGLELVKAKKLPFNQSVFYGAFLQHGDVDRFATDYCASVRSVCESTFAGALSTSRSAAERAAVCAELWRQHRATIAARPKAFETNWTTVVVVLRKV